MQRARRSPAVRGAIRTRSCAAAASRRALDRQRDQPIDQRRVGDAARRPQLRVHADGREAGHGVDLVDERARRSSATAGSRPAPCRRRRWRGTRRAPAACTCAPRGGVEVGGNHRLRRGVEVLGLVVVELARRHAPRRAPTPRARRCRAPRTRSRGRRRRRLRPPPCGRTRTRSRAPAPSALGRLDLGDADARAEVGRLDEQRQTERLQPRRRRRAGRRVHSKCVDHGVRPSCGRPCAAKSAFIAALSMPTAEASTPQPT